MEDVNLKDSNLKEAQLDHVHLERAGAAGANFELADLEETSMEGSFLGSANLRQAKLRLARLADARLIGADFNYAYLEDVRWGDTSLTVVEWTSVRMVGEERDAARGTFDDGEEAKTRDDRAYLYELAVAANMSLR